MNPQNKHMQIGEVYLMRFDGDANEQSGWRPGLVFQNNIGNIYSPNIIALPMTSSIKKLDQPTHVLVCAKDSGLLRDSVVLCENPERMSKKKVGQYLTTLPDKYMKDIASAYLLSSSVISYLDTDALIAAWRKAVQLNSSSPAT